MKYYIVLTCAINGNDLFVERLSEEELKRKLKEEPDEYPNDIGWIKSWDDVNKSDCWMMLLPDVNPISIYPILSSLVK